MPIPCIFLPKTPWKNVSVMQYHCEFVLLSWDSKRSIRSIYFVRFPNYAYIRLTSQGLAWWRWIKQRIKRNCWKNEIIHWALIFIEHQCLCFVRWYLGKQPDKPYSMFTNPTQNPYKYELYTHKMYCVYGELNYRLEMTKENNVNYGTSLSLQNIPTPIDKSHDCLGWIMSHNN